MSKAIEMAVAKFAVAFVAVAMLFSLVAPAANAQTTDELQQMINDLLAQVADLQGQLGSDDSMMSASGVCPYTWTRSLGMGDSGMDVMKLQQFLNADAETMVAASGVGSAGMETEYYGGLTAAAVDKFQTKYRSDILTPAGLVNPTGYFGPSSMAKANALCVSAPVMEEEEGEEMEEGEEEEEEEEEEEMEMSDNEASLEDFDLKSGDDTDLEEGQENAPVAEAEFDVEDGDIEINRVDVAFDADAGNDEQDPWDTFETVSLWVDGDMIAEMDADDEDEYEEDTPATGDYRLRFTGLDQVFYDGDMAEIVVAVSVQGSVDGTNDGETWEIFIPTEGIRGRDGADVDQYTGDTSDTQSVDIEEEGIDDEIKVRSASSDPSAETLELDDSSKSDWYNVFTFQLDTDDSVNDIEIESLRTDFTLSSSSVANLIDDMELRVGSDTFDDWSDSSDNVTFDFDNGEFVIEAGDAADVELWVKFNALATGDEGTTLSVTADSANVSAEGADDLASGQKSGSDTGETHTLRTEGASLDLTASTEQQVSPENSDAYGEYVMTIDVTAVGDTVYVPETANRGASSTVGIAFQVEDADGSVVGTGTTTESLTRVSGGSESGGFVQINDGETVTFELTVTYDPTAQDQYRIQILTLGFNLSEATPDSTQTANPDYDFESGNQLVNAT